MADITKKLCTGGCKKPGRFRCGGCKRNQYCSAECQKIHWKRIHKQECKAFQQSDKTGVDVQQAQMQSHHKEFQRIVKQHGLDQGSKADQLADFLSDPAHDDGKVTNEMVMQKFGLDLGEAKTLLSWIHLGVTFKKDFMDPSKEDMKDAEVLLNTAQ
eukprot:m.74892 g.74892  ORF g.74892 m.74892 type:complete len:157 (-) comp24712_c0_seq1:215-685(-)